MQFIELATGQRSHLVSDPPRVAACVTKMINTPEQRKSVRIHIPFPAVVEGVDVAGKQFKVDTVLDNLSKEGLYLRLLPSVEKGSKLDITFRLSATAVSEPSKPRVAVHGKVLRVEDRPGGACGVAVHFEPARFL